MKLMNKLDSGDSSMHITIAHGPGRNRQRKSQAGAQSARSVVRRQFAAGNIEYGFEYATMDSLYVVLKF